jgi:hypothetical protein
LNALRFIVVTHTFGAFGGINLVNQHAHEDGVVGALGFAHIAVDAFVRDQQGHISLKLLF